MQLNVKVTPETKAKILRLAQERDQLVAEVIEEAIAALADSR
jgi:predicted transcriptional regulator